MLGSPIAHSLSPVLHTAAYAALGLTGWSYDRIECREDALAGLVAGLGPDWVGLSLTMPLKRVALDVADEVTPLARAVGAANTLLLDGTRRAHNTDVAGIVGALGEAGMDRAGTPSSWVPAAPPEPPWRRCATSASTGPGAGPGPGARRRPGGGGGAARRPPGESARGLLDGPLPAADVVVSTLPAGAADPLAGSRGGGARSCWTPSTPAGRRRWRRPRRRPGARSSAGSPCCSTRRWSRCGS